MVGVAANTFELVKFTILLAYCCCICLALLLLLLVSGVLVAGVGDGLLLAKLVIKT